LFNAWWLAEITGPESDLEGWWKSLPNGQLGANLTNRDCRAADRGQP
jgi:hypothetical protein